MLTGSQHANRPAAILTLWERGIAVAPAYRADAMLEADHEAAASLGARNAALLSLRAQLLGRTQALRCTCVHCGGLNEFTIDCDALSRTLAPPTGVDGIHALKAGEYVVEFRIPVRDDIRAAAVARDDESFALALLSRCVLRCVDADGNVCESSDLPFEAREAVAQAMERIEPGATIEFDVVCAECGAAWSAPMDCADVVWSEIQSRAERILLEIDVLARAYGWHEQQVLALSDVRRAAYLQLASAS